MCKKKPIQQRLLSLKFLKNPLAGDTLAAEVMGILMTEAHQDTSRLRFNTVDGCATNGAANGMMKLVFKESCDLVCVSHSSKLADENVRNSNTDSSSLSTNMESMPYTGQ